ncbi:MAG: hypothetical protein E7395_04655 [Ruminococcaceae bacterium]|nr:hypothetical protein [Oscillospiraceae bacterium]
MKSTKICPYCKSAFTTEKNSRKYCRKKCAELATKLKPKKKMSHLCQWCGHIFASARKRKFCTKGCQSCYMRELGLVRMAKIKIPVKVTLTQAAQGSKAEGVSYGTFVTAHKLI